MRYVFESAFLLHRKISLTAELIWLSFTMSWKGFNTIRPPLQKKYILTFSFNSFKLESIIFCRNCLNKDLLFLHLRIRGQLPEKKPYNIVAECRYTGIFQQQDIFSVKHKAGFGLFGGKGVRVRQPLPKREWM